RTSWCPGGLIPRSWVTHWDLPRGRLRSARPLPAHVQSDRPPAVAVSTRSSLVAFTNAQDSVQRWDTAEQREVPALKAGEATALCFSRNGNSLWASVQNCEVVSWSRPGVGTVAADATRWSNALGQTFVGVSGIRPLAAGRCWVLAGGLDG